MVIILPLVIVTIITAVYLLVLSSKYRKAVVTTPCAYSYTKFMKNGKLLCLY